MANLSTAFVRVYVFDGNGKQVFVDLDADVFQKFDEKFSEISYNGSGEYAYNDGFYVYGRWTYDSNLEWAELLDKAGNELTVALSDYGVTTGRYLCGVYTDMDMAMDWCGTGWFIYDLVTKVMTKDCDTGSIREYAKSLGMNGYPVREDDESEDDYYDRVNGFEEDIQNSLREELDVETICNCIENISMTSSDVFGIDL